jgi:hypothetical protein
MRNVGNLIPRPRRTARRTGDSRKASAIEYAGDRAEGGEHRRLRALRVRRDEGECSCAARSRRRPTSTSGCYHANSAAFPASMHEGAAGPGPEAARPALQLNVLVQMEHLMDVSDRARAGRGRCAGAERVVVRHRRRHDVQRTSATVGRSLPTDKEVAERMVARLAARPPGDGSIDAVRAAGRRMRRDAQASSVRRRSRWRPASRTPTACLLLTPLAVPDADASRADGRHLRQGQPVRARQPESSPCELEGRAVPLRRRPDRADERERPTCPTAGRWSIPATTGSAGLDGPYRDGANSISLDRHNGKGGDRHDLPARGSAMS